MSDIGMTDRQKAWFATVQANLETQTGRPLSVWVDVLKTGCPETRPKAQAAWLKASYGIGANHAAFILDAARPPGEPGWDDAEALRTALWKEPQGLAILTAVERAAAEIDGVVIGQRKSFTSFSLKVQFAAMRPLKGGGALLGLKLDLGVSIRLTLPSRTESWSERLTAVVTLDGPGGVNTEVKSLFAKAAENA